MLSDDAVVVTGLGAVSPNGLGLEAFTAALRAGHSGLCPVPFAHEHITTSAVAAVGDLDLCQVLPPGDTRRLPRLVPLGLAAAREAMTNSRLGPFVDPADGRDNQSLSQQQLTCSRRIGLILGTGGGGIDFTIAQQRNRGKSPSLWTVTNATHGNLAGELSIRLGLRGPSHCVSTGCASSSDAFGTAMLHLRARHVDVMVVGGADSHLAPEALWAMQLMGVISTGRWVPPQLASRPFDADRDGFVLGEGAWFAVLERYAHARARGATIVAELAGYASTCDAFHRVRPDPDPREAVRAIRTAIKRAELEPGQIEYIHYHGTGTKLNDITETYSIRQAFGRHADRLAGSSVKSMIGHPQGACGAASLVATLAALQGMDGGEPFLPPTINLNRPDSECDLDYVPNAARRTDARICLINCLAFGSKNSALVLKLM